MFICHNDQSEFNIRSNQCDYLSYEKIIAEHPSNKIVIKWEIVSLNFCRNPKKTEDCVAQDREILKIFKNLLFFEVFDTLPLQKLNSLSESLNRDQNCPQHSNT